MASGIANANERFFVGEGDERDPRWTSPDALGVTKQTAWQRFSGGLRHPITGEEIDREGEPDA